MKESSLYTPRESFDGSIEKKCNMSTGLSDHNVGNGPRMEDSSLTLSTLRVRTQNDSRGDGHVIVGIFRAMHRRMVGDIAVNFDQVFSVNQNHDVVFAQIQRNHEAFRELIGK